MLGGVFTSGVTWRWCFHVNLPISPPAWRFLYSFSSCTILGRPYQGLGAIDRLGALTIVGGTLMFLSAWSSRRDPSVELTHRHLPLVFGVLTIGLFIFIEWKVAKFPVVPMRLFQVPSNIASLAVCSFHGFVSSPDPTIYRSTSAVLGASPLLSGVHVLPFTLSLFVSAATGIIIKRTGKYAVHHLRHDRHDPRLRPVHRP